MIAIGLMSGTSLDAVDAVVFDTAATASVLASTSVDIAAPLRAQLLSLMTPGSSFPDDLDAIDTLGLARRELTRQYAAAICALPDSIRARCEVIGAHGQTIRHRPDLSYTLQILDGALLADMSGLPVVCDLRSADVASGGQGAPLVPVFHGAVFGQRIGATDDRPIAVVNIGGIANVSIIGAGGHVIAGFDTGPGNRLMDDWIQQQQSQPFDSNGQWAQGGQPDADLLQALLEHPYYAATPPKSTGREQFNLRYLEQTIQRVGRQLDAQSVQATLAELTASSIAQAIAPWTVSRVLVCGGGAYNAHLMNQLSRNMSMVSSAAVHCETTDVHGIPAQQVEGAAFAWLAAQRLSQRTVALSAATGARRDVIAGALHLPPG